MKEKIPDPFVEAMKDIVEGKVVPLDKALNEKPPIDWKQAHDMQQKLVISYVLENEKHIDSLRVCVEQKNELFNELLEYKDKVRMLETLIELNMKDFWDVCDQRDWYYEEYRKLKDKES